MYQRASPAVVHISAQVITMGFFTGLVPQEGLDSEATLIARPSTG